MIEYDCLGRLSSGNATGIKRETSSESQQKTKHSIVNVFFCDLHGAFFKIVCRIQTGFITAILTWAKINCEKTANENLRSQTDLIKIKVKG